MNAKPIAAQPPQWYWIAAIWCGLGLFDATQNVVVMRAEGMQHAWVNLWLMLLLSWLPWALATPLVMQMGSRYPLLPVRSPTAWMRHAALWATISLVAAAWMAGLQEVLNPWTPNVPPGPFVDLWLEKFYNQLLSSLILYGCILIARYMLDSRERLARQQVEAARLAEQLTKAELAALRHQVEPHFLFNALNGVAGLVRTGQNESAVEMIARLSQSYRPQPHRNAKPNYSTRPLARHSYTRRCLRDHGLVTQLAVHPSVGPPSPFEFDIAILGGGILGSATAYFLLKESPTLSVCVLEPDPTYEFASTLRASGGCRVQFTCPENIAMSLYSLGFIKAFEQTMAANGRPAPVDWVEGGYLFIHQRQNGSPLPRG